MTGIERSCSLILVAALSIAWPAQAKHKPNAIFSTVEFTHPQVRAHVVESGLLTCFPPGLRRLPKKPGGKRKLAHCETSAAVFDGQRLFLSSDKPIPGFSPVFWLGLSSLPSGSPLSSRLPALNSRKVTFVRKGPLPRARKIEDMTKTPDGKWALATTAFDRLKPIPDTSWDEYNMLLAWPVGKHEQAEVVSSSVGSPHAASSAPTSVELRPVFAKLLGAPYWKIEALVALPDHKLLFGVREVGATYKKATYTTVFLQVGYRIQDGVFTIDEQWRIVYSLRPDQRLVQGHEVAVSSLAFVPEHKKLLLLTSYETGKHDTQMGAYLWTISLDELGRGQPPHLVLDDKNQPMHFAHKAEAIAILNANRIAIIHDDDRATGHHPVTNPSEQFSREANQAAYDVLQLDWLTP